MCRQLRNGFHNIITEEINSGRETSDGSSDDKKTFESDSRVLSGYIDDIHKLIGATPVSFNELEYYPKVNEVKWSGTIGNGIEWAAELGSYGKGFYLNIDNIKVSFEDNRALLKLHAYFDTNWITAIREAIKNKTLTGGNE